MFAAQNILVYLIAFTSGLFLVVFAAIVYMTSVWVKMAEKMKREGKLGSSRQFIVNYRGHAARH